MHRTGALLARIVFEAKNKTKKSDTIFSLKPENPLASINPIDTDQVGELKSRTPSDKNTHSVSRCRSCGPNPDSQKPLKTMFLKRATFLFHP